MDSIMNMKRIRANELAALIGVSEKEVVIELRRLLSYYYSIYIEKIKGCGSHYY